MQIRVVLRGGPSDGEELVIPDDLPYLIMPVMNGSDIWPNDSWDKHDARLSGVEYVPSGIIHPDPIPRETGRYEWGQRPRVATKRWPMHWRFTP